jgi:hypothetical protein
LSEHPGDKVITRFVADDFPLTEAEKAELDPDDTDRLQDLFLEGLLGWDEAARNAAMIWRAER